MIPYIDRGWFGGIGSDLNEIYLLRPEIRKKAEFAVEDHNRKANTKLEFMQVVKVAYLIEPNFPTFLLLKVQDENGIQKLFRNSVCHNSSCTMMKSSGLEYFCEAAETPPQLFSRRSRPWSYMLDSPEIRMVSEFAVKQHNTKTNKQLKLVDVVDRGICDDDSTRDYVEYSLILLAHDEGKHMVFRTKVKKGKGEDNFMESVGLEYLYDAPPPRIPADPAPTEVGTLISPSVKKVLECVVEDHNCKMGTQLEFVDCLELDHRFVNDTCEIDSTFQVTDQEKHKIFKTHVKKKYHASSNDWTGVLEFTRLEYVSETQPRPKAHPKERPLPTEWISLGLIKKTWPIVRFEDDLCT